MSRQVQHGSGDATSGGAHQQSHQPKQQEQFSEASQAQQDGYPSQSSLLPGSDADRLLQGEPGMSGAPDAIEAIDADNDAEGEEVSQLHRREERHRPQSLEDERIGLQHVSGTDEAEIGKELNISGAEEIDRDEDEGFPAGQQP